MVVPHCGSKTINVRLTVSPDSKLKSDDSTHIAKPTKKQRLKSRKLFKNDDNDDEGSGSGCFDQNNEDARPACVEDSTQQRAEQVPCKTNVCVPEKHQSADSNRISKDTVDGGLSPCCLTENSFKKSQESLHAAPRCRPSNSTCDRQTENIYESAPIVTENIVPPTKASTPMANTPKNKIEKIDLTFNNNGASCCRDCRATNPYQIDTAVISKPSVRKLIRKSRSRKQQKNAQDSCPQTRVRSLSVGNENSFRTGNRRALNGGGVGAELELNGDVSSGASAKERNDECLNSLRRNDLIDIIRESMEKSRLCFQSNG